MHLPDRDEMWSNMSEWHINQTIRSVEKNISTTMSTYKTPRDIWAACGSNFHGFAETQIRMAEMMSLTIRNL